MILLVIISWTGASRFNGGICFLDGEASFLSGEGGSIGFDGRVFEKNCWMGGNVPLPPCPPPLWETLFLGQHCKTGLPEVLNMKVLIIMNYHDHFLDLSTV